MNKPHGSRHTSPLEQVAESDAIFTVDSHQEPASLSPSSSSPSHKPMTLLSSPHRSASYVSRAPLPIKSLSSSKEAQYDADSDELGDTDDIVALEASSLALDSSEQRQALHNRSGTQVQAPSDTRSLPDRTPLPDRLRASVDGITHEIRHLGQTLPSVGVPGWDGEGMPDWLKRGAGVFDATVNMANSILGAGIVGLPYSMRESGFVAGLFLLVFLSLLTDWTIRLIVLNAKLSGRLTYIDIMEHCFGANGKAAVSIFQFAFAFGGMCAFCVVIGDTIPHVIKMMFPGLADTFLSNRQFAITFFTITISYPLSLYRNIESLSKASAIALVSMVVIIITVTIRGPAMPTELKGDPSLRFTIVYVNKLVRSISVISFAFVCHHNSLLIYGSLKEPSMNKFGKVTHYSTIISAAATITMSVAGYWSFEEKTLGNVLNNFPETDFLVNIARGLFGLNMLTTLPLECFVCREVLETYFFAGEFDRNRHLILTSSLVISAMMVSLLTCDLGIVLELTGGLSATALAFIFPSLCYLKLTSETGKRVPTGNLPVLTSTSWNDGDGGQPTFTDPVSRTDNRIRTEEYCNDDEEEEDHGNVSLERLEGGLDSRPRPTEIDLDHVQLPLRPGASIRFRPPATKQKWWESTRLLSILCAIFGIVVLIISVITALTDTATGREGAVHVC